MKRYLFQSVQISIKHIGEGNERDFSSEYKGRNSFISIMDENKEGLTIGAIIIIFLIIGTIICV